MFGRKKERPISFFFSAKDGALHLYPDRLEKKGGGSVETLPLSQLEGGRLEDGEDLDRLYITTSRENLPDDVEPASGSVYLAEVGVKGLEPLAFAG